MDSSNIVNIKFQIQKPPVFKEVKGKDWVLFGDDEEYQNRYPDFLIDLFNRCGKHNAIITGKANFISGKGWTVDKTNLTAIQQANLYKFVEEANPDESLNDILNKAALDLELFGGFALEIIWGKASDKIAGIYHADFSKIRSSADGTTFYFSDEWDKYKPKTEPIPAFDLNNRKGKQLLYYKQYRPKAIVYPYPDYLGIIPSIATDIEITNFHYNNIKTGFLTGTLINFLNGDPGADEKKEIEKKVKAKTTGTDNAGGVLLNFADGKERAAEVIPMRGNDFDKMFLQLRDDTTQEIFTGHKITSPMLFGIKSEGQLGGRTELLEAYELFQNTYITPKQQILEGIFNGLALVNGFEKRLQIQETEPIGFQFSESVVSANLTQDEIREMLGRAPIKAQQTGMRQQFNSDLEALEVFKRYGQPAENYITLKSKPVRFESHTDCLSDELDIREQGFADVLDIKITALDKVILDLIQKNPLTTVEDIAKATGKSRETVESALKNLEEAGAMEVKEGKNGPERKLTGGGKDLLESKPPKIDIFIMYAYSGPKDDRNRAFCAALLELNRVYSRQDIEAISKEVGRNVWETRGGWYNQNGVNRPSCRHIWEQRVTRKTNG